MTLQTSREIARERNQIILAHLSDIHVMAKGCQWAKSDWFSKRTAGWINLHLLGRGLRFRHTQEVLSALLEDLKTPRVDQVVFSGDATALGFEEEMAQAANLLGVHCPTTPPGLAVPGNHDYHISRCASQNFFEHHFAPWQKGIRIGNSTYPFAQKIGPAWLVAVNSCTANRLPWDARGRVGKDQLFRLEKLLSQLEGGPRILVTHYPIFREEGKKEKKNRALRDLDDLVRVAVGGKISLWLHGHLHNHFNLGPTREIPFPVVCAGSATQTGNWAYSRLTLTGTILQGERRQFDPLRKEFRAIDNFEMDLPG